MELAFSKVVNVEALDAQLRAALPGRLAGLVVQGRTVRVNVLGDASVIEQAEIERIIGEHDGGVESASQTKRRRRAEKLAALEVDVELTSIDGSTLPGDLTASQRAKMTLYLFLKAREGAD